LLDITAQSRRPPTFYMQHIKLGHKCAIVFYTHHVTFEKKV